ncbi:hypothetical protein [Vibrio tetraodonis]|uniref:hypothetical protein n=1 Tax=Vibrio tetraodonis TaxID=2231647 RepID=UPI000E0B8309|nr:hypothetical protein [Vibrio tetraodonis]
MRFIADDLYYEWVNQHAPPISHPYHQKNAVWNTLKLLNIKTIDRNDNLKVGGYLSYPVTTPSQ